MTKQIVKKKTATNKQSKKNDHTELLNKNSQKSTKNCQEQVCKICPRSGKKNCSSSTRRSFISKRKKVKNRSKSTGNRPVKLRY